MPRVQLCPQDAGTVDFTIIVLPVDDAVPTDMSPTSSSDWPLCCGQPE